MAFTRRAAKCLLHFALTGSSIEFKGLPMFVGHVVESRSHMSVTVSIVVSLSIVVSVSDVDHASFSGPTASSPWCHGQESEA